MPSENINLSSEIFFDFWIDFFRLSTDKLPQPSKFDIFSKFKDYNVDVNIINTSQFDITTTTDDLDKEKLEKLKKALEEKYNVNLIHDYDCVSIVGDNIKKYKKINQIMNTIKNFDIKYYKPRVISVEFIDYQMKELEFKNNDINRVLQSDLYKYFISNDYHFINWSHADLIFVHKDFRN